MNVGITSDGRVFRNDPVPRLKIKYPYRAVICGKEHIVKGWSGGNLLTDKGEFAFHPLSENGASSWPPECRLLEVATIQPAGVTEWLLNGHRLSLMQFRSSGKRLISITQDEGLRIHKREICAVAWYLAVSAGSQTAELDVVLDDWQKADEAEAIAADAGQLLSRLNSLLFIGWSKPIWLTRFYPVAGNDSWFAGLSEKLHASESSPATAPDSVADMLKKGINPWLVGLENISLQPANPVIEAAKPAKKKAAKVHRSNPVAKFENDFTIAVIPQKRGKLARLTVEAELRKLIKEIVQAGGSKPRTELRKGKSESWQPEKLLESKTAKALIEAKLLGKDQKSGRTVVYWAREDAK
jgi:hypothetical protein